MRDAIQFGVVATALTSDVRQAPRLSRLIGFSGVQFDAISSSLDFTALSGSGRRELLHLLANENQQLIGLRADLGAKGFGFGSDPDQALSRLEGIMEAAARLGAPLVCVDMGPLPPAPRKVAPRPKSEPKQAGLILLPERSAAPAAPAEPPRPPDPALVGQVSAAMAELGRHADRYSVVLALRSELSSMSALHEVLRQANCPWFGVDLDPVALLRDEWGLDEFFSQLGPLIRHVRARDAIASPDRRTKASTIGQGSVAWEALLSNLDDAGYQGWLTIDSLDLTDRSAAAIAGLKFLQAKKNPGS